MTCYLEMQIMFQELTPLYRQTMLWNDFCMMVDTKWMNGRVVATANLSDKNTPKLVKLLAQSNMKVGRYILRPEQVNS
jgi:hypothetical protein